MTLLGILFVVGVAFLATMNFEADMISAERLRSQSDNGVDAAVEGAGAILRNSVMSSPGVPFGDSSLALSGSAFAEMSGVHNSFSPLEPVVTDDGRVVFRGYYDALAHSKTTFAGPVMPPSFAIYSSITGSVVVPDAPWVNGQRIAQTVTAPIVPLGLCPDGTYHCDLNTFCVRDPENPADCLVPRVADADGDGIVDSLLVDAKEMGLSSAQLADLATRVNPASNLAGKVSVALRVVPHGGMVNLNQSHPLLIHNVFDITPDYVWPEPPNNAREPESGFRHSPKQRGIAYSPVLEEPLLRRRNHIPSREFQPSMLHGNPVPGSTNDPDMASLLFWRDWSLPNRFQDVVDHRFMPFRPTEFVNGIPDVPYWSAMMEPSLANVASPPPPWNLTGDPGVVSSSYDRRHLVTTASHDDLLARTAMVETPRGKQDLRQAMLEANWTNFDPDQCLPLMPFEYVNYPTTMEEEFDRANYSKNCCPDDPNCQRESMRGRLQLSLPWIDEQLLAADSTSLSSQQQIEYRERVYRIIHDVFFMLVRNATQATEIEGMTCQDDRDCPIMDTGCLLNGGAVPPGGQGYCVHGGNAGAALFTNPSAPAGPGCLSSPCAIPGSMCRFDGVCTLTAPAWRDVECPTNACDASEFCLIAPGAVVGVCAELWTRMPRSEALVARTAASLTANMIDFVDVDNVPTRVAIRHLEFGNKCNGGGNHNLPCADPTECPGGTCMNLTGRDIDLDPVTVGLQGVYVYGLERQPYITEVATLVGPGGPPAVIEARAVEIFNPEQLSILADDVGNQDQYFLYEVDTSGALTAAHVVTLTNILRGNDGTAPGPFTTYYWEAQPGDAAPMLTPPNGTSYEIAGPNGLTFGNGWTIYLVRRLQYGADPPVDIVIDQFTVVGDNIAKDDPNTPCDADQYPDGCFNSLERLVRQADPWTVTVPWTGAESTNATTLGTWNGVVNGAIHPVEIVFPNTGTFGVTADTTRFPALPTTGTLSLLMRHSGRAITDFTPPPVGSNAGRVLDLAFNTDLAKASSATARMSNPPGSTVIPISHYEQIDNGRIPLFDTGTHDNQWGWHYAHHMPPSLFKPWDPTGTIINGSDKAMPGDLNTLPWGQLVFDYFTALPLTNGGPYAFDWTDPDAPQPLGLQQLPRIDEGGLRVHGRININAAPWKVLSGLPMVPLNRFPAAIQAKLAAALMITDPAVTTPIGPDRAQAIVAYRDARGFVNAAGEGTGNYDDGSPVPPGVAGTPLYGRGWTNPTPMARRGTGFMGIGELANVRHDGATAGIIPPGSTFRLDSAVIDTDQTNNNDENFIEAAAFLIALGDWVSVRSHVFTVYGQIRGADDDSIVNPTDPIAVKQAIQVPDTDSRAIRFQETIDRLPVLQGRARPQRIGERTVGRYTDVNSD